MTSAGFPHSETLGSQLVCQLPEDYRRLQRPSSAPSAKASTNVPLKTSATLQSQKPRQHTLQQPTDQGIHPDQRVAVSGLGKIQRCSRPLCSSQATDEPTRQTRNHHHRHAGWSGIQPSDPYPVRNTQPPTLPHPPVRRTSRAVREAAGCLRTQQCARQANPYDDHHVPSHPEGSAY